MLSGRVGSRCSDSVIFVLEIPVKTSSGWEQLQTTLMTIRPKIKKINRLLRLGIYLFLLRQSGMMNPFSRLRVKSIIF
jgi:hypothetical protein